MFGVHFSTNKAHITIHKFSLVFLYKRGCVPYLRHFFLGFVIFTITFESFTFRLVTLGLLATFGFTFYFGILFVSALKFRILFGHTLDYYM